jgi:hypothetical protein
MRKDIVIPKVEHVYVVAIQEWNDDFMENSWYAYLVNDTDALLEMAICVSRAFGKLNGEERKTGMFRHMFNEVQPNSAVKLELLENNVLELNNEFSLSFFKNGTMFDKKYLFRANTINIHATQELEILNKKGVKAE